MALLDTQGFVGVTTITEAVSYGLGVPSTAVGSIGTDGPNGAHYWQVNSNTGANGFGDGNALYYNLKKPTAGSIFYFGARVKMNIDTLSRTGIRFAGTGGIQFTVAFDNLTGFLQIYRGNEVQDLISTSSPALWANNSWFFVEVYGKIDQVHGEVTVRINEAPVLELFDANTNGDVYANGVSTSTIFSQLQIVGAGDYLQMTDIHVLDDTGSAPYNTFLGDCRIVALFPTGNSLTGFTPIANTTNWQIASQLPVNLANYNAANSSGLTDTFTTAGVPVLSTIYAVHLKVLSGKLDAGTRVLAPYLVSGGTSVAGSNVALGISPVYAGSLFTSDPNTGSAWTLTGVNNAQIGYTVIK